MKLIKYFNKEIMDKKEVEEYINSEVITPFEFEYEIKQLEYECKDKEFDHWLDVIQRTYGQYGEVTFEDIKDIKTQEELTAESIANLMIEGKKKDFLIQQLSSTVANLTIEMNKRG